MKYREALFRLRRKVPVGMQEGLLLLERHNGDPDAAAHDFRESKIDEVVDAADISRKLAHILLIQNDFDLSETIRKAKLSHLSWTERMLQRNIPEAEKVWLIGRVIEDDYGPGKEAFELNEEGRMRMPESVLHFMVLRKYVLGTEWKRKEWTAVPEEFLISVNAIGWREMQVLLAGRNENIAFDVFEVVFEPFWEEWLGRLLKWVGDNISEF